MFIFLLYKSSIGAVVLLKVTVSQLVHLRVPVFRLSLPLQSLLLQFLWKLSKLLHNLLVVLNNFPGSFDWLIFLLLLSDLLSYLIRTEGRRRFFRVVYKHLRWTTSGYRNLRQDVLWYRFPKWRRWNACLCSFAQSTVNSRLQQSLRFTCSFQTIFRLD